MIDILDGKFSLEHKVAFIVPSTNGGESVDLGLLTERTMGIARKFSAWFGGATVTRGAGFWLDGERNLIEESVDVVLSHCDESALADRLVAVVDLAADCCADWSQSSIAVDVDGRLVFVEANHDRPDEAS